MEYSAVGLGAVADQFNRVLIINLDHRKDRWATISKHLNEIGVKAFDRVPGVNGAYEPNKLCTRVLRGPNEKNNDEASSRQRGVLGCLKGHLKAFKAAQTYLKRNDDKVLILEDDAFFVEGSRSILETALRELPNDWYILMLGAMYNDAPGFVSQANKIVRVWNASAAHAYLVNKRSCSHMIEKIEQNLRSEIIIPIDELFIRFQPQLKFYATNPLIAGQRSGDLSDIEGVKRVHTIQSFKLGITITPKVWLWMKIRVIVLICFYWLAHINMKVKHQCLNK